MPGSITRAQVDAFRRVPAAPALHTAQSLRKRLVPMPLGKQLRGEQDRGPTRAAAYFESTLRPFQKTLGR